MVGDKIKIIKLCGEYHDYLIGKTGEVTMEALDGKVWFGTWGQNVPIFPAIDKFKVLKKAKPMEKIG